MKLYILHGWAYDTEKWGPFLKLLRQNKVSFELLKIPGLTASLSEAWTLSDYVNWLNKTVAHHKSPVVLLGHSNGGRIALAYTLKHPEKVSRLILIDSAGISHNELNLWLKRFAFNNLARFKKIAYNTVLKNLLYKFAGEDDYNKATPIMKQTMQNLIKSDLSNELEKIKTLTTIIWGESDNTTPLSDGRLMSERIANSKLFIIKNAKHSPQFTHTQQVTDLVLSFLNNDLSSRT